MFFETNHSSDLHIAVGIDLRPRMDCTPVHVFAVDGIHCRTPLGGEALRAASTGELKLAKKARKRKIFGSSDHAGQSELKMYRLRSRLSRCCHFSSG